MYGTTVYGGASGCSGTSVGTIFKITTNGVFTTVVSFDRTNVANPQCGLILGRDGALYGSTTGGGGPSGDGYGTIFRLTTNGAFTSGTNGSYPHGDLIQVGDGCIYGRTITGGLYDYGTLFRLTTNGVFTTLLSFDGTNGIGPWAAMTLSRDGNLYGATAIGGSGDGGVAFRLVPAPRITQMSRSNQVVRLTWSSFTNGVYRVEQSISLTATSWTWHPPDITATGNSTAVSLTSDTSEHGFYRVALRPWNQ